MPLPPSINPVSCADDCRNYSIVVEAHAKAVAGHFYVTGHTDNPVLVQYASMASR